MFILRLGNKVLLCSVQCDPTNQTLIVNMDNTEDISLFINYMDFRQASTNLMQIKDGFCLNCLISHTLSWKFLKQNKPLIAMYYSAIFRSDHGSHVPIMELKLIFVWPNMVFALYQLSPYNNAASDLVNRSLNVLRPHHFLEIVNKYLTVLLQLNLNMCVYIIKGGYVIAQSYLMTREMNSDMENRVLYLVPSC
jgi:hypothetical protein